MAGEYYASSSTANCAWQTWTSTASNTTSAWPTWIRVDAGTTAGADTQGGTWTTWVTINDGVVTPYQYRPIELTAEQQAEQERRREIARIADEERQREQEAAVAKAEELLLEHLNPEQHAEYLRDNSFRLIKGEKTYLVRRGRQHNVFLLDEQGREAIEYCIHVGDQVPDDDNVLAQKLLLESDEEKFLRVANARRLVA